MIRILHIVTYMGRGGLETMLMNYYRHIDRSKVQFDFLVHRNFEADYDREILSLGGKIHHVSRLIPWSCGYKNELKAFFRAHPEYRIVHVHQDCLSSVALQCAKECEIPVRIAHSHSSSAVKDLKYPIKLYYRKRISKYATVLFACGKAAGDWMFCGAPYTVVQNAICAEDYRYDPETAHSVRAELGIQNQLVIGHVGRFRKEKNHPFLLEVFAEVLKKEKDARLLLVGDGEDMSAIQEKAIAMGLANHVIFTGSRPDVNQLLQAMDVFVFPSLYEGFGIAMIEAQATGLPCLVSTGVPEGCRVTEGLVNFETLAAPASIWAERAIKLSKKLRMSQTEQIIQTGYDIVSAAKELEAYYIAESMR